MKIKDIIKVMEKIAPPKLACSWDTSIGLQIGDPETMVKKVLVTLDVSEKAVKKAVSEKADLIISHHALFFTSPDTINTGTPLGKKIQTLMKNNIAVFVAHTNLDSAEQGVNYWLAKKEGLDPDKCEVIEHTYTEELCKLAVFVPKTHIDKVRDAISQAGAGHIGNYSHCTFNVEGVGTFKPLKGTDPYVGKKGKLEKVEEIKLETIVSRQKLDEVVEVMKKAHPYEEVAYDIYPLLNKGKEYGLGLVGELKTPKTIGSKKIRKLAVCSGGGGKLIEKAYRKGAQAVILGECSYHDELLAKDLGVILVQKGHFETENVVVKPLADTLKKELSSLQIVIN